MKKYKIGHKVYIVNAGVGSLGCNDCLGVLTKEGSNYGGSSHNVPNIRILEVLPSKTRNWNVKVGQVWAMNYEDPNFKLIGGDNWRNELDLYLMTK
jgi:hypothetical protein